MLLRRRRSAALVDDDPNVIVEHGPSLAKGPALLVGSILVAFGLTGLLVSSTFPSASSSFPNGTVNGSSWLGIEVNGWTCFFAITAGALLLLGAAQHHLAKTMSLIVGAALAACAVIAIIDGHDVLGLAAANVWTKVGFAVAGGAMLLNALMPRTTRRRRVDDLRGRRAAAGGDATAVDRGDRFDRHAGARDGIGRPAAEQDLADAEADRTTVSTPRGDRGADRAP